MKVINSTKQSYPPPTEVTIILTETEVGMLKALTLKGIDWNTSGDLGIFSREMFYSLDKILPISVCCNWDITSNSFATWKKS